ncbi:AbiV family abortive infection protein [Telluribacter sp. SYSU D00476]|uniref:AbiV family abortive infection protein n=1 Tax=Telluribacter sp. SYSU D00476 TaxID=2811430 RepID=UPI001FF0E51F|nr:AbiV family abortive infection protein [Telluribacter sp. SYSU D00476]
MEDNTYSPGIMKTLIMNKLNGIDSQKMMVYLEIYQASLSESVKLLGEAELLLENESYERAYFLGFASLEEISKSQMAADVFTGIMKEEEFQKNYTKHNKKISRIEWIKIDGNSLPQFAGDGIEIMNFDFSKKLKSMYVDSDFDLKKLSTPSESVSKSDAENIIKAVKVGLSRIYEVTIENGEQIGTKGFMK